MGSHLQRIDEIWETTTDETIPTIRGSLGGEGAPPASRGDGKPCVARCGGRDPRNWVAVVIRSKERGAVIVTANGYYFAHWACVLTMGWDGWDSYHYVAEFHEGTEVRLRLRG